MWFNDTPSKRLFCLIVIALFVPAVSVGIQYGPSKQLVHSLMLNFAIPIVMIVASQGNVGIILAAQVVGLAAFIHAIWLLCAARNQSSPGADFDLEGAAPPPVYDEPSAPVVAAPKSGTA